MSVGGRSGEAARSLLRDRAGAVAVEFSLLGFVLLLMMLGVIQFSLVYITSLQLKAALSEAAAGANNPKTPQYQQASSVRTLVCNGLLLADSCTSKLKLEEMPADTLAAAAQPITGATYDDGDTGDLVVIRAKAPVITFVPGVPSLSVTGAATWLNR